MDTKKRSARDILDEFRRSGLTQKAFCESQGIAKSTLGYWLRRERKQVPAVVPLVRVPISSTAVPAGKIVVRHTSGIVVEIERPIEAAELKTILETVTAL